MNILIEVSAILVIATAMAGLMQWLKQPLLIGYLLAGLLAGPLVLDFVHSAADITLLSRFGVAALLFVIALDLNPKSLREITATAIFTGLGQVILTGMLGFAIATALGFDPITAAYIAMGLALSSTVIVLKLLADKKDSQRLYGKIATGFLLVQDVVAVLLLLGVATLGRGSSAGAVLIEALAVGLVFLGVIALIARYLLPRMAGLVARSQEFLFLFALAWGFLAVATAQAVGFSVEIAALAAGIALAATPYSFEIGARLRPLRDFLLVIFFIVLGGELVLINVSASLLPAIALSILILIGNPLIVMSIMGLLGYTRKTSFKAGLAVAQISEFSHILLLLGRDLGHLSTQTVAMMTVVSLITIAASTYMVIYSDQLYRWFEPYLRWLERKNIRPEREIDDEYNVLIVGFKAGSRSFIDGFRRLNVPCLVVDYDPEVIDLLNGEGIPALYGDANDADLLDELPIETTELVIVTASDFATNVLVVDHVVQRNAGAVVIAKAEEPHEARDLYDLGATYVMMPHFLGSLEIMRRLAQHGLPARNHFARARDQHLAYLRRSHK